MDRSLAGRLAIGHQLGPTARRRAGQGGRHWFGGRGARRSELPWWHHSRPLSAVSGLVRAAWAFVLAHRRMRIALLGALIALALLAGGWLWLRNSSLVAVERVHISGVRGPEAAAIETALAGAARHMSTLEVNSGALRAAVAPYRVVREVHTSPSFPHGLHIDVVEQLPVAALTIAGERTAVAADGVILGPGLLSSSLPTLSAGSQGSVIGLPTKGVVHGASLLSALIVLGAAPARIESEVRRVFNGPKGVTALMRNGLAVYFGDAVRPHAKWLALARVLADPSSAGATYVDVRVPERPAAGGFTGTTVPEQSTAGTEPSSPSDPNTAAELAAGLTAALGSGVSPDSPASQPPAGATPAEAAPGATQESGSAAPVEAAAAPASRESSTAPSAGG
jgi:cell division protein FtsQ